MTKYRYICFFVCLCAMAALSAQARAVDGINTSDPSLPPTIGAYMADPNDFHRYPGVDLSDPIHDGFRNITRTPVGPDERENFDSDFRGNVSVGGGPGAPIMLTGPVTTMVFGKVGNVTGDFATEILSMELSGPTPLGPVMIRESPTLASTGRTMIADIGGGMYHIDSFFDVFTELSIDGGQSWQPSLGSTRMKLCIPEPASIVLFGLALVGLAGLARRRY